MGFFIRRDKYSTREVNSRGKRGKLSKRVELPVMDLHGDEDSV